MYHRCNNDLSKGASGMMGRGPRSEPWGTPLGDNEIYLGNMSGGLSG